MYSRACPCLAHPRPCSIEFTPLLPPPAASPMKFQPFRYFRASELNQREPHTCFRFAEAEGTDGTSVQRMIRYAVGFRHVAPRFRVAFSVAGHPCGRAATHSTYDLRVAWMDMPKTKRECFSAGGALSGSCVCIREIALCLGARTYTRYSPGVCLPLGKIVITWIFWTI